MANIKFSAFTIETNPALVEYVVGYQGGVNVKIAPADLATAGGTGLTEYIPRWTNGPGGVLGDSIMIQQAAAGVFSSDYIEVSGLGGLSTQNLEINNDLYDGTANPGNAGDILSSLGVGFGLEWVTPGTGINLVTDISTAVGVSTGDPINTLTNATGSVTITLNEYAGAANEGFVPSGGTLNNYLDGTGAWSIPVGTIPWPYQYDLATETLLQGENPAVTVGANNTSLGVGAGTNQTALATNNTLIGKGAGSSVTDGFALTLVGVDAGSSFTTGGAHTAVGFEALKNENNELGNSTAIGYKALQNQNGPGITIFNTAVGGSAGTAVTTGASNTFLGYNAGFPLTTGNSNIAIGGNSRFLNNNDNDAVVIGKDAVGHGSNIVVIGNDNTTAWHPHYDKGVDLGSSVYSFKDSYIEGIYYDTAGNAGNAGEVLSSTATGTSWIPTGSVTSVALTMPAAFSVAGSPITSSGTFAVTGSGAATDYIDGTGALQTRFTGTTAQYYRGDGTLATFTQAWNPPAIILSNCLTFWNNSGQLDSSNDLTLTLNGSTDSQPTIGIGLFGVANSKGSIEIDSFLDYNSGAAFDYFLYTSTGGPFLNFSGVGAFPISVHASGRFMGSGIHIFSDERIKKDISISNSKEDLETISKIEISNYKYIDPAKGTGDHKKVIAQQVQEHYPLAVNEGKEIVPDVFKQAVITDGVIDLSVDCKVGDKLKLIYPGNEKEIVEVLQVNENSIKVDSSKAGSVVVYGKEVDDYKTVDYDALSMLNISATQELYKIIKELKQEIELLKNN